MTREYDSEHEDNQESNDIAEAMAEDMDRGVDLAESAATEDGAEVTDRNPYALDQHHLMPEQYREYFQEHDINIDRYTIDLDRDHHQSDVHAGEWGGAWNAEWGAFFDAARENGTPLNREMIVDHLNGLMEQNGLTEYDIHAYNDHATATNPFAELSDQTGIDPWGEPDYSTTESVESTDFAKATETAEAPEAEAPEAEAPEAEAPEAEAPNAGGETPLFTETEPEPQVEVEPVFSEEIEREFEPEPAREVFEEFEVEFVSEPAPEPAFQTGTTEAAPAVEAAQAAGDADGE